ncbi:DUF4326 domain-containing protein [Rhizobium lentis]|uniref:DUF4326 domain-containing protein n=1 Tax=Rhizobium lentis TaxID=1138194 RepID=A0A7W8UMB1_9HYPH|nr:DUF4326 domain-containing protein [Rhizobium lentis]MBB4574436.1 hypothetical protein [Rhizobium lentis]MBB5550362.1 hypothetical protein [Rhizobium lentis]MBB5560609.1 hypothetical protein [Rhizobium lentis]MBB5567194.1 hypothetical protein [Rhizobium lentis]
MTTPVRLQLSRAKGFNLQAASEAANGLAAIKVDRTSPFGNHYAFSKDPFSKPAVWDVFGRGTIVKSCASRQEAVEYAIECYRADICNTGPHNHRLIDPVPTPADIAKALRGFNLACWCKLGEPCHADILLELANAPLQEVVSR